MVSGKAYLTYGSVEILLRNSVELSVSKTANIRTSSTSKRLAPYLDANTLSEEGILQNPTTTSFETYSTPFLSKYSGYFISGSNLCTFFVSTNINSSL